MPLPIATVVLLIRAATHRFSRILLDVGVLVAHDGRECDCRGKNGRGHTVRDGLFVQRTTRLCWTAATNDARRISSSIARIRTSPAHIADDLVMCHQALSAASRKEPDGRSRRRSRRTRWGFFGETRRNGMRRVGLQHDGSAAGCDPAFFSLASGLREDMHRTACAMHWIPFHRCLSCLVLVPILNAMTPAGFGSPPSSTTTGEGEKAHNGQIGRR